MSKFYVGQKVVAIKNHSQGIFKQGDEFTVLNIIKSCCSYNVDVGIRRYHNSQNCVYCGKVYYKNTDTLIFAENCFSPIELSTTTFEDVIKQLEPCLN